MYHLVLSIRPVVRLSTSRMVAGSQNNPFSFFRNVVELCQGWVKDNLAAESQETDLSESGSTSVVMNISGQVVNERNVVQSQTRAVLFLPSLCPSLQDIASSTYFHLPITPRSLNEESTLSFLLIQILTVIFVEMLFFAIMYMLCPTLGLPSSKKRFQTLTIIIIFLYLTGKECSEMFPW